MSRVFIKTCPECTEVKLAADFYSSILTRQYFARSAVKFSGDPSFVIRLCIRRVRKARACPRRPGQPGYFARI